MPSRDPIQRFEDILENIIRIEAFTAGMDLKAFVLDQKTSDAVERCLERISEAAKKLDALAEETCPGIPWAQIRGIGNHLRHEYDKINGVGAWFLTERDLAPLKAAVHAVARLTG